MLYGGEDTKSLNEIYEGWGMSRDHRVMAFATKNPCLLGTRRSILSLKLPMGSK